MFSKEQEETIYFQIDKGERKIFAVESPQRKIFKRTARVRPSTRIAGRRNNQVEIYPIDY